MADDIVDVPGSKKRLESKTAQAYIALLAAARADGIEAPSLEIKSGYRTRAEQEKLWADALIKYGTIKKARKWVAPPGRSAHETGHAVDFNIEGLALADGEKMKLTASHRWLVANAARFGFTPYAPEPWHWTHNDTIIPGIPNEATGGIGVAVVIVLAMWLASGA